jgi:hypothetical protein
MTSTEPSSAQYDAFNKSILKIGTILDEIAEGITDQHYKLMYEELMSIYQKGVIKTEVIKYIVKRSAPRRIREPLKVEEKLAMRDKKGRKLYDLCSKCDRCIKLKSGGEGMRVHLDSLLCKSIKGSKKYSIARGKVYDKYQEHFTILTDHFIHKFEYGVSPKQKKTLIQHGVDIATIPAYFV